MQSSGSAYPGLDRFNRIVESAWTWDYTTGTDHNAYEVDLEYDRNSNITWAYDRWNAATDVKYDMMAEAGGERAVLFATDPPYCVGYDGTNHPQSRPGGSKGPGSKSRQAPRHPLGQSSRRAGSARPFGAGVLPRRDAAESEDHRVGDWVVREVNAGVSDLD